MEDYDNTEYRKKKRAEALFCGEGNIDFEELKQLLTETTQGPWHWVEHDYSTATLQGPAEEWDHVTCVSPCRACMERAKETSPDWKWGRCTCPTEPNAKLMAMAPMLAEAYLSKPKYPIVIESHIYQYDEGVFVWFDETGGVGGASNYLEEARDQMKRYAQNM
jgi:hypothetical protein